MTKLTTIIKTVAAGGIAGLAPVIHELPTAVRAVAAAVAAILALYHTLPSKGTTPPAQ